MVNYTPPNTNLQVYGPEGDDFELDKERLYELIENTDAAEDPLVDVGDADFEKFYVQDGILKIAAWTGNGNGDGWYVHLDVPLLARDDLRELITELAEPLGLLGSSSTTTDAKEVLQREVDDQGRISVGKKRAGDTVKVAVLED